jgi:hypothetical protein
MKYRYLALSALIIPVLSLAAFRVSYSFFSDTAQSTNNTFAAAAVFPTPSTRPLQAGDVIINELDWAGSTKGSDDEWIELKNTTDHSIDISNWQVTKWVSGGSPHEDLMLTIPTGENIGSGSFFLIAAKSPGNGSALAITPEDIDSHIVLSNSNLQIKLYDSNWDSGGLWLDTAGDKEDPLAGEHQTGGTKRFYSMERNSIFGDGKSADNWHTATTSVGLDSDSDQNKGTPDAAND